jgi:hypothetical protein
VECQSTVAGYLKKCLIAFFEDRKLDWRNDSWAVLWQVLCNLWAFDLKSCISNWLDSSHFFWPVGKSMANVVNFEKQFI